MTTFLDVVELLLTDGDAKAAYSADPGGFLNEHGLGALDSADVADAMLYATDSLPLSVATQLDPEAGLDSAAALDLEANGLTLEREAVDAVSNDTEPADTDPNDSDSIDLQDDVEFDMPSEGELDIVDVLDVPDGGGNGGNGGARADDGVADAIDPPGAASPLDGARASGTDSELETQRDAANDFDELTDFTPVEVATESSETSFEGGLGALPDLEDLEAEQLEDIDPGDLDFLE